MNRIYKIAKRYGKGTRARTCAAAFLAALALTGVMGMSEVQAQDFNSVNTNALNSKYNLSVGTAADNGTMPFFVNSNGAFYAAKGNLVVDKDGNVAAGSAVLNNGVFTGKSALRDGELFVGDASGNYSQITPNSAKLGQVTIDDKGYITGANYVQTNALNSKYNFSVGTAADNGTMPFFVNSTGDFYAANNKFSVNKDGKVTATAGEIGGVTINKGMISNGAAKIALYGDSGVAGMVNGKGASIYMQDGNTVINSKVAIDKDGKITGVAAGAVTAGSTDAVNGSQLYAVATEAAKHSKVVNGSNIKVEEAEVNGQKIYKVGLNDNVLLGNPTGNNVSISGTNGTIETTGSIATKDHIIADKGAQLAGINVSGNIISNGAAKIALYGDSGVAGMVNGKGASIYMQDGNTVINSKVAIDKDGKVTATAGEIGGVTLDKGMISNGAAKIALYGDSGVAGMVNGKGASIYMQDGNTVINSKVAIDKDGKVTGVAAGAVTAGSKDAVNGGQLYATNQLVKDNASNISLLGNSIDKLDNRVNKVGAGAAALAALHPLDFDPEDKWDFAAGYGNYSGASAVALGAYYRPNEDTMFSVGGSFGNGENMVNAGVSLKLGQSSHAPASKAAMEKKISALSQEVEELKAAIADLRAAQTKAKDAQKK